jgi:hypothetical protein
MRYERMREISQAGSIPAGCSIYTQRGGGRGVNPPRYQSGPEVDGGMSSWYYPQRMIYRLKTVITTGTAEKRVMWGGVS